MSTALQLHQIINQLTEENAALLEIYAEFLLYRQKGKSTLPARTKGEGGEQTSDQLKRLKAFKGKAKYPNTPTNKYEVYEQ